MTPDHPNWSWHEYGMRVGFWRIKRMLDDLGIRPTVTLNAKVCEDYPEVAGACLESGWEFNAHSYEQLPMHKLDDERSVIEQSLNVIENFTDFQFTALINEQKLNYKNVENIKFDSYSQINEIIEGIFNFSIEMNGIGIVSAKYKEINELFTERRVLNFSFIFYKYI